MARFTDRELDVMSILWRSGPSTVNEVRDALGEDLAYTSVLSALQTLEQKGAVDHEREGRAYRYHPLVESEAAGETAVGRIVDKIFQGSAALLVAQLVQERRLPEEELRRIRDLIERELGEGDA